MNRINDVNLLKTAYRSIDRCEKRPGKETCLILRNFCVHKTCKRGLFGPSILTLMTQTEYIALRDSLNKERTHSRSILKDFPFRLRPGSSDLVIKNLGSIRGYCNEQVMGKAATQREVRDA